MTVFCNHKWRTTDTVSHKSHLGGAEKFRFGFHHAKASGIELLVARRKKCENCQEVKTTVELDWNTLKLLLPTPDTQISEPQIWEGDLYPVMNDDRGWKINVKYFKILEGRIHIIGESCSLNSTAPLFRFDEALECEGSGKGLYYRKDDCKAMPPELFKHSKWTGPALFSLKLSISNKKDEDYLRILAFWYENGEKVTLEGDLMRKEQ